MTQHEAKARSYNDDVKELSDILVHAFAQENSNLKKELADNVAAYLLQLDKVKVI